MELTLLDDFNHKREILYLRKNSNYQYLVLNNYIIEHLEVIFRYLTYNSYNYI